MALIYWDVFLGDISFYLVLEVCSSFSSRSYPPVRKRSDHCGVNMITNIALKTRTWCYSFGQYVRKCNDSLVVNMMAKKSFFFRTEWYLLCYCCCVKHPAHRNSKSRVYPMRCQDSRCCCCWCCSPVLLLLWFGHTHAHKNCASDLWVEGIQTTTSSDTPAGRAASRP